MTQEIDQYRNKILCGDCLEVLKTLPGNSIQMCVTSPPYYALRNYNVEGQIGHEETPEQFVNKIVEVFEEVKRVLRPDGVCFLNMGDSYWQQGKHKTLKQKDLCLVPQRLEIALQDAGWYIRNDIVWWKPNPIPFPVTDRLVNSHETIIYMTKSSKCFYDAYAVKEPVSASSLQRINQPNFKQQNGGEKDYAKTGQNESRSVRKTLENFASTAEGGRNKRDVWFVEEDKESSALQWILSRLNTVDPELKELLIEDYLLNNTDKSDVWRVTVRGTKEVHFATFSDALITPAILAGTSEKGACPVCNAPYKRIVEKGEPLQEWKDKCGADSKGEYNGVSEKFLKQDALGKATQTGFNARWKEKQQNASDVKRRILEGMVGTKTVAWEPTCKCYNNKRKGIDIGQSPQSFAREDKIAILRAKSREDAIKMYPDDQGKQKEYIRYVHDHGCSDPATMGKTVAWSASCTCDASENTPCIVLDPFMGSGTTAIVAQSLGRDYIGIELNKEYIIMAERRIIASREKAELTKKPKVKQSRFDNIGCL